MGYGGCNELCLVAMGLSLVTLFSLSVYYPEHILAYGSRKARYALVVGSGFFRID